MIGEAPIKLGEIRMDGEKTSRTVVAMVLAVRDGVRLEANTVVASGRLSDRLRNHVIPAWCCCYEYIWTLVYWQLVFIFVHLSYYRVYDVQT